MKITGKLLLDKVEGENREEWLKIKSKSIGSSEIAVIMGESPFSNVNDLYQEKKTGVSTFQGNNATKWGNLMEPLIFNEFIKELGFKGKQPFQMYCHKDHSFATCSPDGFLFDERGEPGDKYGLVEIKNVSAHKIDEWTTRPPSYYWAQVQWQLGIMGLRWAFLVAKIDNELIYHKIFFDSDWFERALVEAKTFLIAVKSGKTYSQVFNPREYTSEPAEFTLSQDESATLEDYKKVKAEISALNKLLKPLEERRKELETQVMSILPAGGKLITADGSTTLKLTISTVNVKPYSYEKRTFTVSK